jgi:hypothetical protein
MGYVAPYGTPLNYFISALSGLLESKCGYSAKVLHLSRHTRLFDGLTQPYPTSMGTEYSVPF